MSRIDFDVESEYNDDKRKIIESHLKGDNSPGKFTDVSEEFLKKLEKHKLKFIILMVDIVDSTQYAQKWEPKKYERFLTTFMFETSDIVPKFNGFVLKYLGDGLIAFFTDSENKHRSHLALECALTIKDFVYKVFNPIAVKKGYPSVDIRIGIDSGKAYVSNIGSPSVKQHKDIIGQVMNITTKIENSAKPGEIYAGEEFVEHLLKKDLNYVQEVKLKNWPYKVHNRKYKVFKILDKDVKKND